MNMREFRSEDLERVMEIANQAWQPIRKMSREILGDAISDLFHPQGDAVSKGLQVKEQIDSGTWGISVCEHENQIIGFITYCDDGVIGEIGNNAACPPEGVKGTGQCMYNHVLEIFRRKKLKVIKVTTGLDWAHAPARRAYERAGFKRHLDSTTYFMEL